MVDLRSYRQQTSAQSIGTTENVGNNVLSNQTFDAMIGAARGAFDQMLGIDKESLAKIEKNRAAEKDLYLRKTAIEMDGALKAKLQETKEALPEGEDYTLAAQNIMRDDFEKNPAYQNMSKEDLLALKRHRLPFFHNNFLQSQKDGATIRVTRAKNNLEFISNAALDQIDGTNEAYESAGFILNSMDMVAGLPEEQKKAFIDETKKKLKDQHFQLRSHNFPENFLNENNVVDQDVVFKDVKSLMLDFEGTTFVKDDGNGFPAKFGVNQKANPDINVADLKSWDEAWERVYKPRYWDKIDAGNLPQDVVPLAMNMAVNMGVETAAPLIERSGHDLDRLRKLAYDQYADIIRNKPDLAKYQKNWASRIERSYKKGKSYVGKVSDVDALKYVKRAEKSVRDNKKQIEGQQYQSMVSFIDDADIRASTDLFNNIEQLWKDGAVSEGLYNKVKNYVNTHNKDIIKQNKIDSAYQNIDNYLPGSKEFEENSDLIWGDVEEIFASDADFQTKFDATMEAMQLNKGRVSKNFIDSLSTMLKVAPMSDNLEFAELIGMVTNTMAGSQYSQSYKDLPANMRVFSERFDALLKLPDIAGNTKIAAQRAVQLGDNAPDIQVRKQGYEDWLRTEPQIDVPFFDKYFTDDLGEIKDGTALHADMMSDYKQDVQTYMLHGMSTDDATETAYKNMRMSYGVSPTGNFMKLPPSVVHGNMVVDPNAFNDFIREDIVNILKERGAVTSYKDGEKTVNKYTELSPYGLTAIAERLRKEETETTGMLPAPDVAGAIFDVVDYTGIVPKVDRQEGEFFADDVELVADSRTKEEYNRYKTAPMDQRPPVTYLLVDKVTGYHYQNEDGTFMRYGADLQGYQEKVKGDVEQLSKAIKATRTLEKKSKELGYGGF